MLRIVVDEPPPPAPDPVAKPAEVRDAGALKGRDQNPQVFQIGDLVMVSPRCNEPRYGWGNIDRADIGIVTSVGMNRDQNRTMIVDFKKRWCWAADPSEMDLVYPAQGIEIPDDRKRALIKFEKRGFYRATGDDGEFYKKNEVCIYPDDAYNREGPMLFPDTINERVLIDGRWFIDKCNMAQVTGKDIYDSKKFNAYCDILRSRC